MFRRIGTIMLFFCAIFVILPYFLVQGYHEPEPHWQSFVQYISSQTGQIEADFPVVMKTEGGDVVQVSVKDYLYGSVAAEMLPNAPEEALKAQAVASYTYMIHRKEALEENPNAIPQHSDAYVCCNPGHCKAYISKDDAYTKWGREYFNSYWPRITAAVDAVLGKAVLYEGEPIDAVFFAISSGETEDCIDVWGSDIPYLKSVDSSQDKNAKGYETTVTLSYDETVELLKSVDAGIDAGTVPEDLFADAVRADTGNVLTVSFGEVTLSGREIRTALGLRSSIFDVQYQDGEYIFTVKGYGHGVGLSQAGAIAMAEQGYNYEDILKHYYTDVTVESYPL